MMRTVKSLEPVVSAGSSAVEEDSGFGVLRTERGCLPLVAMDVRARIAGLAAHTTLRQTFRNALDVPLEATYIFPLPDRAAVTSFRMTVAGRVIEGELKERGQAREEYDRAIEAGHRAAIAEEERSGTFSLRVGNIPPKEDVAVELALVGPLPLAGGEATFRFPLVVAPRYVPGIPLDGPPVGLGWGADTDQVPDASRVTPPVLLPGFPNPVRLSLEVELDPAGLDATAGAVRASLHSVISDDGPPWTVRLNPGERLDRDFILRFPLAGGAVQTALLCAPGQSGKPGTFALTLVPPAVTANNRPAPRDVVFVLDRSGSMQGWKMVAARRAVGRMVDTLLEQDRFTVQAFDDSLEYPDLADRRLVEATDRNRWRVLEWLGKIDSRGGTEMGPALKQAIGLLAPSDGTRQRVVILITDGQVAGEDAVLKQLKKAAGKSMPRVHTIGIDQAVNAGFLQRLADLGGGVCELVESEDRLDDAMDGIHRVIGTPALTQLCLEPQRGECVPDSVAPSRMPDLFADRPVTIFGRIVGDASGFRVRVRGQDAQGRPWQEIVAARSGPAEVLGSLWGRARVRELEDRYAVGGGDLAALAQQIVDVSLESHVLSRFTAYVAVDRAEVVNPGGQPHQVVQPVELPSGWEGSALPVPGMPMPCAAPMPLCAGSVPQRRLRMAAPPPPPPAASSQDEDLCCCFAQSEVAPSRAAAAIAADVRAAVAKLQGRAKFTLRMLSRLMELLAELLVAAQVENRAEAQELEALVRRMEELLRTPPPDATEVKSLLEAIAKAIENLAPPAPPPKRRRFWA